jgi:hypothetical protein
MAERRMFAKTIIDSDAFNELPLSAQALYFHYVMNSDENGKLNNPKAIIKAIGANLYDLQILLSMGFISESQLDENDFRGIQINQFQVHNGGVL